MAYDHDLSIVYPLTRAVKSPQGRIIPVVLSPVFAPALPPLSFLFSFLLFSFPVLLPISLLHFSPLLSSCLLLSSLLFSSLLFSLPSPTHFSFPLCSSLPPFPFSGSLPSLTHHQSSPLIITHHHSSKLINTHHHAPSDNITHQQ